MDLEHGGAVLNEEYSELRTILNDPSQHLAISSLIFDPHEELVWAGNHGGYLKAYHSHQLQRYTSFHVHQDADVRQLLGTDPGILSLMRDEVRCNSRKGPKIFSLRDPSMTDLQCMIQKEPTTLLAAGHQNKMLEIDLTRSSLVQEHDCHPGIVLFKRSSRFICCGRTDGKVEVKDPLTLKTEHILEAHTGTLSDFDISGNLLVTCGFASRLNHMQVDRFIMVYDLRSLRGLTPIQAPFDPFMLKFVPALTSRLAVVSQSGQFQFLDTGGLMTPSNMMMYQVNTHGSSLVTFDISSSSSAMVFGDDAGYVHMWSKTPKPQPAQAAPEEQYFNSYSRPTEFADEVQAMQHLDIHDYSVPLSSFPLQYCNQPLLSNWPQEYMVREDRRTPMVDPEVLKSMIMTQYIGYAPNPGTRRRNQVAYPNWKRPNTNHYKNDNSDEVVPESPMSRDDDPMLSMVPKNYRKVEIKYSKLGVEDFDFGHYNKTNFAGLEIHIPNAYCNALLQVMYFMEPMRVGMQNHVCDKEFCLTCELGFLFNMLDKGHGANTCQASNFLRAFRTIPEASALGLVLSDTEESTGKPNFSRLIQNWLRFVLQQVAQELEEDDGSDKEKVNMEEKESRGSTLISKIFGSVVQSMSRCRCGTEVERESESLVFDLTYPDPPMPGVDCPAPTLESVITSSICKEQVTTAWCDKCGKYQPSVQNKRLKSLPDVFAFNCQVEQPKDWQFWRLQYQLLKPFVNEDAFEGFGIATNSKPCRYGNACTRADCRFFHDRDIEAMQYGSGFEESNVGVRRHGIPFSMKVSLLENGEVKVERVNPEEKVECKENERVYDLLATVGHVHPTKGGGNLVAHLLAGPTYNYRKEGITHTQWYLINDFAIIPIDKDEAINYNPDWKIPCVLMFTRRDLKDAGYDLAIKEVIESQILFADSSVGKRPPQSKEFTPLHTGEMPGAGEIVGLDAEFVTLNQEEAQIRCDGTQTTIKPSQMSVARITVVRGTGPLEEVPFIDDYISTTEQVVDYLTKFSGINPEDLDKARSSKHLTTLKTTYKKLRYLADHKVVFVGHGLKKDFRVINIFIPKDQIKDTVHLFHIKKQRYVSLKFLAWYFLGLSIQSGSHDSAEDARTALKLYRKYEEISKKGDGELQSALRNMYEAGRQCKWQVPVEPQ